MLDLGGSASQRMGMQFPKNFVWGAATASYQIEGSTQGVDGCGESVWDMCCKKPGFVHQGHTGYVACDHYNRYHEDVGIMQEIGLKGYRFSLMWPRILPEGTGVVNEKGLDFYSRLVDELLAAGVEPWITLFHWDYPYALFQRGGWLNRASPDWYAEYTQVVVERLGDRVKNWITFNEPQCFVGMGHGGGGHAPGLDLPMREVLLAAHHVMLAHGKAVQVIRAGSRIPETRVGYAPVAAAKIPLPATPENIEAAREETFAQREPATWVNAWWNDPIYLGQYPEDGLRIFGADAPKVYAGDMETICQPLDFCAFNCYNGQEIRRGEEGGTVRVERPAGFPETAFKWPVTPQALRWIAKFMYERYQLPIVVTENGMSANDWVSVDGKVHDPQRIDLCTRYLREYRKAATEEDVPLMGYFLWSLMDNFEWARGYGERFGLVFVDYQSQRRVLKDSAYWYRDVIASNGGSLGEDEPDTWWADYGV